MPSVMEKTDFNDGWLIAKKKLEISVPRGQYDLWIAPLEFLGIAENCVRLGCRNHFHIQWLKERLHRKILEALKSVFSEVQDVRYEIASGEGEKEEEIPEESPSAPRSNRESAGRQLSINDVLELQPSPFNPRFTFDHFVVGACNQLAYASSMAVATGQSFHVPSLYLISDSGLGKSHLSHAVGNYVLKKNPRLKVRYVTAEQFTNEMIAALKNDRMEVFKKKYRASCDILLLERVEFLSGKEKIQSELLYTIDELLDRGKKIICTGSKLPREIPKLHEDLKSRLSGVLVAPIEPPDFDTRLRILQKKASQEGAKIPPKVLEFLAGHIEGDVRKLESCLIGLIAKSNILGIPADIGLAREVVAMIYEGLPKVDIALIQQLVCETFDITPQDLTSPSRKKQVVMARKIAFYLCREYTRESLQTIGSAFNRNHSTVVYAINDVKKKLSTGKSPLTKYIDLISRKLKTRCVFPK